MSAVLGAIIGDIAGSKYEFNNRFDKNFEDCIKTAISYGGDSDCIANMAGSIAGALYHKEVKQYENKALTTA